MEHPQISTGQAKAVGERFCANLGDFAEVYFGKCAAEVECFVFDDLQLFGSEPLQKATVRKCSRFYGSGVRRMDEFEQIIL